MTGSFHFRIIHKLQFQRNMKSCFLGGMNQTIFHSLSVYHSLGTVMVDSCVIVLLLLFFFYYFILLFIYYLFIFYLYILLFFFLLFYYLFIIFFWLFFFSRELVLVFQYVNIPLLHVEFYTITLVCHLFNHNVLICYFCTETYIVETH